MAETPPFLGIHHIKLPSAALDRTVAFYTTHLPFAHLPALDHTTTSTAGAAARTYAKILRHAPTGLTLEIRDDPAQAAAQRGWDPVTWAVPGRADLGAWRARLAAAGVPCSAVLRGFVGWVLVAEDPDGRRVRLYTREEHAPTPEVDVDEYWLPQV